MESGNYNSYSSFQNTGPYQERNFSEIAGTIGTNVQKIIQNVSSMKRMVNLLGTTQDLSDTKSQLYKIQHYTQQLVKDTSHLLKQLNDASFPTSPSEQRTCKMQKTKLAEDYSAALNAFQEVQKSAHQKETNRLKNSKVMSPLPPPPGNTAVLIDDFGELENSGSRQVQRQQDFMSLREAEEQEQTIRQLENDIRDVNQIYKELGVMIHDQGEMIDSIEAHVERTEAYVSDGNSQLKEAAHTRYKIRRKKLVCLSVLIVFVVLLSLWVFWPSN